VRNKNPERSTREAERNVTGLLCLLFNPEDRGNMNTETSSCPRITSNYNPEHCTLHDVKYLKCINKIMYTYFHGCDCDTVYSCRSIAKYWWNWLSPCSELRCVMWGDDFVYIRRYRRKWSLRHRKRCSVQVNWNVGWVYGSSSRWSRWPSTCLYGPSNSLSYTLPLKKETWFSETSAWQWGNMELVRTTFTLSRSFHILRGTF
jgi:hypothetical protein